jgi:4-azaleucine resistance transporter AzlC
VTEVRQVVLQLRLARRDVVASRCSPTPHYRKNVQVRFPPPDYAGLIKEERLTQATHPIAELTAGARDIIPMMVGAAPFGVIFGTLVAAGPLHPWHGQLMSLVVFAGSAQFIALGLIAGHASFIVVWATTLVVNLRHVLYSATLAPHVAHLPSRWRWALGALLTDEVFAVAWEHYRHREPGTAGPYYFFGAGFAMYLNWQVWTVAGLLFGAAFPGLQSLGLDFAMVVTFIAIVVPQLVALRYIASAVTAGALAFFWQAWPYKLGLLGAVLAGVAVGVLLSRPDSQQRQPPQPQQRRQRRRPKIVEASR